MSNAKLQLRFGGYSTAGIKDENQDAFTAHIPADATTRQFKGGVACIADGISNSVNAKMASETAVTNFALDYYSTPDFWSAKQSARKVIGAMNAWLYQQSNQSQLREDGFITTFSAMVIKSHTAHILHVGDSRIYRLRDGQIKQLTRDHCFYSKQTSSLTRALGFEPQLELDYHAQKVRVGDRFLLTTDGVHEHLKTNEISNTVDGEANLELASKTIVERALKNGSSDNCSALIVDVEQLPNERISEAMFRVADLVVPPELVAGNRLDHFEIKRVLHSSPRSHVYLARDTSNDTRVVIKAPSLNFAEDERYLEGFAREQWVGRKLEHSHIVKILPPIPNTKFLYHVCQFIEGQTLRQWMTDNPNADLKEVREIVKQLIQPLRALKRNSMVHQDVKPDNFMIDRDGRIILIDLGSLRIDGIEEVRTHQSDEMPESDSVILHPKLF